MIETPKESSSWLDRPVFTALPAITREKAIFILIVLLAIVSRLYDLGTRVFSHDENLHVYFSWLFSIGKGYQHTPLMHGPLQFHLLALTYLFFGASDFTARLPHAAASIMTIILLWKWRRFLGRTGTLIVAGLTLISPFMLYYGRYARNEAFIGVFFLLTLYAILRYLETGKGRYLILLTIATALHFTSKETAFIYTAQALLFLAVYLTNRVSRASWKYRWGVNTFLIFLTVGVLLLIAVFGFSIYNRIQTTTDASQTAAPILPGIIPRTIGSSVGQFSAISVFIILSGLAFLFAAAMLIIGYGWKNLCRERSFDMLILLCTFVLPQLAAFPVSALGWNPLEYQFSWPGWNLSSLWAQGPVRTAVVLLVLCIASITIGLLWNKRSWPGYAVLFWGIYILFFTSIFTNWQGFFTGTVGSLGYWLQQQGVHRGDQPWYYYLLIQVPVYEFLPAIGIWLGIYFGFRKRSSAHLNTAEATNQVIKADRAPITDSSQSTTPYKSEGVFTFQLLLWWTVSSVVAYTLAGEKMPWLTFHIALPMLLLTGWGLGKLVESVNWQKFHDQRGFASVILLVVMLISLAGSFIIILGAQPPFQGKTQDQLAATGTFLLSIGISLTSAGGLYYLARKWKYRDLSKILILVFFFLLAVRTARTAFNATFIHPNDATEYLVYAHGGTGIQGVMDQVRSISGRIAGEQNLKVAYDNNLPNQGVSWSFKWYLRNFPNAISFDKVDKSLLETPIIIVDQQNFENIKPIIAKNYYRVDYIRMVWPNQDYFGLTWPRIKYAFTNATMRDAIFQIWLNRDYSEYAKVTGKGGLALTDWQPSARMQLYIRKDIANQMWEYGISSQGTPLQTDPYEKGMIVQAADLIFGSTEQLNTPRGIVVAPDGSIYVADSRNNRIVHYDSNGQLLQIIGQTSPGCPYATIPPKDVPIGTFCEPWAVAVSPDGQWIYVADTWNHRIQKLSASGDPIKAWGTPNYDPISSGHFGLWGPRAVIEDLHGRVIVADTGNKRIIIYDADGGFITQIGGEGAVVGQFDEPVGLAADTEGNLFVADTWNQRIQVFVPNSDLTSYSSLAQWDVAAWSSQSADNKPYLSVDQLGHVFTTDPDSFRVLEFTTSGEFVHAWGGYGTSPETFGMPSGISVDNHGGIWVSDSANNRIMRFTLP